MPFHFPLSSAALREYPNPIPVHSLMLPSHMFFRLPLLLTPFTVPCRIVFAMPEDLEMWPYQLSFRFITMVRRSRSSCTPFALWILLWTSSLVQQSPLASHLKDFDPSLECLYTRQQKYTYTRWQRSIARSKRGTNYPWPLCLFCKGIGSRMPLIVPVDWQKPVLL